MARMTRLSIAAALLALALIPTTALAKSPPKGDYGCTYSSLSGTFFGGTLNILGKSKYSVNDKKKGRYTTKGKTIRWRTGDYKSAWALAKWRRSGGTVVIGLYAEATDDSESTTCTRS